METEVVIIDDDAVVLFLHKIMVQRDQSLTSLHCFNNASEAHNYICNSRTSKPLIVLLDINMPKMNGWDLLDKLIESGCYQKAWFVVVTSSINISDRKKAAQYDRVIDFIEKPLSKDDCSRIFTKFQFLVNPL